MPECATCRLFQLESEGETCFHVNHPGGVKSTELALELCQLPTGAHILDVGSGTSVTLKYLAEQKEFNGVGLDLSIQMLRMGHSQFPDLNQVQADCSRIPLANASEGAILMECALSLTGISVDALTEFKRVLVPGGKLIVTDVYIRELADRADLNCLSTVRCLKGVMTAEAIQRVVAASGFKLLVWQDQTNMFKQWLARMVFQLGSLDAFYRQLASCERDAESLGMALGKKIKLGYYLLIAEKENSEMDQLSNQPSLIQS